MCSYSARFRVGDLAGLPCTRQLLRGGSLTSCDASIPGAVRRLLFGLRDRSGLPSRLRFSRYARVSYASASDCGPTEIALRRGCRMFVSMDGISDTLGITSSSLSRSGTRLYCLLLNVTQKQRSSTNRKERETGTQGKRTMRA